MQPPPPQAAQSSQSWMMGRAINKSKSDQDLILAIRKAISADETSPKQKHVRTCIVYTWDHKTSTPFWIGLKNSPMLANEVQCFKALITIHKVIRQGHPTTLPESIMEVGWLQSLPRLVSVDFRGYSSLIRGYLEFISHKLQFHQIHPDFTGTFDYEEYTSLKRTADPNEGYETISELMALQNRLDAFQRTIFASLNASHNTECRLSSLVALIEESYAIYRFITSMLRAIHSKVGSIDALEPLRRNYVTQFYMLKDFYTNSSEHRYLTSLITIPSLGDQPPSLYDVADVVPVMPTRPPTPHDVHDDDEDERLDTQADVWEQFNSSTQPAVPNVHQAAAAAQHQEEQWMAAIRERDARLKEFSDQLIRARHQYDLDQQMLLQYDTSLKQLQAQLASMGGQESDQLKKAVDEVTMWKGKYEALAKLYAQLRKEHLELLTNYKTLSTQAQQGTATTDQINKLQAQLNAKNLQLADLIASRDKYQMHVEMQRQNDSELDSLRTQLKQMEREYAQFRKDKEEEVLVLQAGMDQSILAMAQIKATHQGGDGTQVADLELKHAKAMDAVLDAILTGCSTKIKDAGVAFDSGVGASLSVTPEYTLSVIDQVSSDLGTFAQAFSAYISGGEQVRVISSANAVAFGITGVLAHTNGCLHLGDEDSLVGTAIRTSVARIVRVCIDLYSGLTSGNMGMVELEQRPKHVNQLMRVVTDAVMGLAGHVEKFKTSKSILATAGPAANLEAVVADEMNAVSASIEHALQKLQLLLSTPRLDLDPGKVNVHSAILGAAMALIQAIMYLIKCAVQTQHEITMHGKSTCGSVTAFYKQHHRWTEGLVSAAKAVGIATNVMVDTADGMVQGTQSMEQLCVAASEIGASTAQLVAASRVKSVDGSRTQGQLEHAASAVTSATRELVKAAKDAARVQITDIVVDLSNLSVHDLKTREMEQQVKILTLEKEVSSARALLAQMRKTTYHTLE